MGQRDFCECTIRGREGSKGSFRFYVTVEQFYRTRVERALAVFSTNSTSKNLLVQK